jgi:pimeloyl-ACP methyl ester carboxylesterase
MKTAVSAIGAWLLLSLACSLIVPATSTAPPSTPRLGQPTSAAPPAQPVDMAALLDELGGVSCPDSDFTCITLQVPLDHSQPDGETIDVVFGVLPASGERKGLFVTATGGPGTSGLLAADGYTAAFDPSIPEHFDIVFFDQRGMGLSGGLQCPEAATALYRADWDASSPQAEAALGETARTFAEDCVDEMGDPALLPFLGTDQAVQDLEAFRVAVGDDTFWLYGESYGTQFAQTYAAAYPQHLAGLILDGTVDLTLSGPDFYRLQAQAFNDVLEQTLQACTDDEACAAEMGGGAVAIYDSLAANLRRQAQTFEFPLPEGGTEARTFSASDLETAAAGYLYSETARMIFLRALAAYARDGDLVPLARVLYDSLSVDPQTEAAVVDPSFSDAVYYGVECLDYAYPGATQEERLRAYLDAGDVVEAGLPRFASIFYGDVPCVYWPNARTDAARPDPLTAPGIPTLVLGGTADPATPYQNGLDVYGRLDEGYHITETGGPHVIFGWGVTCVDDLVTAFLVRDERPASRSTCEGVVADEFVPLAPRSAAAFADPLEALASFDDEFYYLPEYYYWDYETPTSVGCPFGGTLTFEPSDAGETFAVDQCAFSEGFIMTGAGSNDYESSLFTLEVTVSGMAPGVLTYSRDADGNRSARGEYDGQAIDLSG